MTSAIWIAFFVGIFLGATLGILAIALCVVAKKSDGETKGEGE